MSASRKWTPDEDRQLADIYGTGLTWSLTERLQRTEHEIHERAATLGIPGPVTPDNQHLVNLLDDVLVYLADERAVVWSSFVERSGPDVGRIVEPAELACLDRIDALAARCRQVRDALDVRRPGGDYDDARAAS